MKLWDHPMSENDFRQCLRIATGATIGFTLCKVFGWNYGVFFTVTPMLLLGMVPVMSLHAARQLIFSAVVCGLEVGVLGGLFGGHPGMMTIIAFGLFLYKFACMSKGSLFLFGANSVLSLSIMLHFASYPTTDLNDLIFSNLQANVISVIVAYVVTFLIPDAEPRQPPAKPSQPKQSHRMRHEALWGRVSLQCLSLYSSYLTSVTLCLLRRQPYFYCFLCIGTVL